MKSELKKTVDGVLKGDERSIGRAMTLIENRFQSGHELRSALFKSTGKAKIIGVTGSPGSGKSTLVDRIAKQLSEQGKKVGIIAVDPTSPFSGGAILGDRVRMSNSVDVKSIYIRSMATRGSLGGISAATADAIFTLDAAGYNFVIIETVGVGQAEVDIARLADTCLVVLVPGMGDEVQMAKAGILEIADIFVVNKSDRPGVEILLKELKLMLSLPEWKDDEWQPKIQKTVATEGTGIFELVESVNAHQKWLGSSGLGRLRRLEMMKRYLLNLISWNINEKIMVKPALLNRLAQEILDRITDPDEAIQMLMKEIR